MHKVQCDGCRNEVEVAFYFSDKRIITYEENALNNGRYYEAICRGESICPICGCSIEKLFKKIISNKSIVDLAVGDYL
jgi:uncharacterized protein (UPF0212 family)